MRILFYLNSKNVLINLEKNIPENAKLSTKITDFLSCLSNYNTYRKMP